MVLLFPELAQFISEQHRTLGPLLKIGGAGVNSLGRNRETPIVEVAIQVMAGVK